jgi:hypothetical protein
MQFRIFTGLTDKKKRVPAALAPGKFYLLMKKSKKRNQSSLTARHLPAGRWQ